MVDDVGTVVAYDVIRLRFEHPLKAFSPIEVTPLPICKVASPAQFSKALAPTVFTLLGNVTDVIPVQPLNAAAPISSTLLPNSTDVISAQP